jgi:hypothetical protein
MTAIVKDVVLENNINATIDKVEDIMEIMKFNVMTIPALVVDDMNELPRGRALEVSKK